MKEGKGSGGNLFDDGAETNSENWTVYQMIRHQSCSPYLVACCQTKKYVEIRLNPGLTSMIFTTWPGHPVATTFSLGGTNSNSELEVGEGVTGLLTVFFKRIEQFR